ncbi:acyltransferase family protein [Rhizobium sp. SGZ-381]|uniref:acyltransferase family protein n=1 Tax=Rhizobium sp. SGZ-381 TaxID=3342800 RepID=UPI003671ED32
MSLTTVQAGRALAALAVVLFHTEMVLQLDKYLGTSTFPAAAAMQFGVNFFFVLSGFIITTVHWRDLGVPEAVPHFLVRRLSRIYPPLWAALALSVALMVLMRTAPVSVLDILFAVTAFPLRLSEPLLAVEWTLRHEILFYLLFLIAILRPWLGLALLAVWAALPYVLVNIDRHDPLAVVVSPYNTLFLFGMISAWCYMKTQMSKISSLGLLGSGIALFALCWLVDVSIEGGEHTAVLLVYGVASAAMLTGMVQAERLGALRAGPVIIWLGDASYSIYLVHFLAISATAKIVAPFALRGIIPHWAAFLFVTIIAVSFGILFYLVIERSILLATRARLTRRS